VREIPEILLIRHGETEANATGRYQGHWDVPLNKTGEEQAQKLADYLKEYPASLIYSSDLKRAYDTADLIAKEHSPPLEISIDNRLREIHVGAWQGLTWEEIQSGYSDFLINWRKDPWNIPRPGGGESDRQFLSRIQAALEDIAKKNQPAIVLTHGGAIRSFVGHIQDMHPYEKTHLRVDNTSLTLVTHKNGKWEVQDLNLTPHL